MRLSAQMHQKGDDPKEKLCDRRPTADRFALRSYVAYLQLCMMQSFPEESARLDAIGHDAGHDPGVACPLKQEAHISRWMA